MERRKRSSEPLRPAPAAPPLVVAECDAPEPVPEQDDGGVQIVYGASLQNLPLAGQTISHIRPALEMMLRLDARSPVLVNGVPADADYVLASGDVLEFVHRAGEKGRHSYGHKD